MKRLLSLVAIGLLAFAGAFAQEAKDDYDGSPAATVGPGAGQGWFGPNRGSVLYDNGPLINSMGTGSGGADESVLQGNLAMNTLGFGHQVAFGNRVADDFTVTDSAGWQIDTITFFAYQTGSTTTSTITAVNLNIWDGPPAAPGSAIVFTTNATGADLSTAWSGIYRVTDTTGGANNRPIMANVATVNTFLAQGTYWLDWQVDGSLASGPWAPPVTINGQTTTGNGLQSLDDGVSFAAANDSGTLTQQGFPFIIEGSLPCQITDMTIAGNQLTIMGMCLSGVDIYYEALDGTIVFVQGGVSVDGSTTITLSSVAPDSIYFCTAAGTADPRLAQTGRTVPTLGEWALMAFILMLMVAGVYFMKKRRMAY